MGTKNREYKKKQHEREQAEVDGDALLKRIEGKLDKIVLLVSNRALPKVLTMSFIS